MCRAVTRALGLAPKMPALPAMPAPPPMPAPMPQPVQQVMQQADTAGQDEERRRARAALGRASTILTGGQGVTDEPVLARAQATGGQASRMLLG